MDNSAVRVTVLSLENEAETVKMSIESVKARKNDAANAKTATENRIAELLKANEEENLQAEKLRSDITELLDKAASAKERTEQKLKERTELEAEISKLTAEERDLSAQKERLSSEVTRLTERRDNMQKSRRRWFPSSLTNMS